MDLRKLKTLIDLVSDSNVSELEITEAEGKVRIVKGGGAVMHSYAPAPVYAAPVAVGAAPAAAPAGVAAASTPATSARAATPAVIIFFTIPPYSSRQSPVAISGSRDFTAVMALIYAPRSGINRG